VFEYGVRDQLHDVIFFFHKKIQSWIGLHVAEMFSYIYFILEKYIPLCFVYSLIWNINYLCSNCARHVVARNIYILDVAGVI